MVGTHQTEPFCQCFLHQYFLCRTIYLELNEIFLSQVMLQNLFPVSDVKLKSCHTNRLTDPHESVGDVLTVRLPWHLMLSPPLSSLL